MSAKELPEDLVIQILLRLPVVSLLRFRCVCKSWCTLISNHDFITKHLKQSSLNEDTHYLIVHRSSHHLLSMLSFQTLDLSKSLPVPYVERVLNSNTLLASCNGVICLEDSFGRHSVLWNPTTRETKIVPNSLPLPSVNMLRTNYRGFGFDAKTNDYKVVQISLLHNDDDHTFRDCQVEVYSLRSDSWRKIDFSVPAAASSIYNDILHFREMFSWLYTNGMFSWSDCETLLSFDMSNEVFLTTPLPDATLIELSTKVSRRCFVRDESVALVACKRNVRQFDIWVLCKYGVKESWTKVLTVGTYPGIGSPLGFWKNGQVFLRTSEEQLCLYDPISQDIKYLQIYGRLSAIQLTTYVESLVSIKGGN